MLKVLTTVTENYNELFNKYYLKSFPKNNNLNLKMYNSNINIQDNTISYEGKPTHSFKKLMYKKLRWQRHILNYSEQFFYIDADVIFINDFYDDIKQRLLNYDIIFQDNNDDYNFGVFAVNRSDKIIKFFDSVTPEIKSLISKDCKFEEQSILNHYIKKEKDIKIGILPLGYFAGHIDSCKYPNFPNEKLYLYHATNTYSYDEKIKVLEDVNKRFSLGC